MIDRSHNLPLMRQTELLRLGRSTGTTGQGQCLRPSLRSCGGSMSCIRTIRSRAAG